MEVDVGATVEVVLVGVPEVVVVAVVVVAAADTILNKTWLIYTIPFRRAHMYAYLDSFQNCYCHSKFDHLHCTMFHTIED